MSLTRKDYVMLAATIKKRRFNTQMLYHFGWSNSEIQAGMNVLRDYAEHLAAELNKDNPKFDIDRFLQDCGAL